MFMIATENFSYCELIKSYLHKKQNISYEIPFVTSRNTSIPKKL